MKINHTPATPLQWAWHEQGEANDFCLLTHDNRWVISFRQNGEPMPDAQRQNAAYLVHAANAYPKLIEALQKINGTIYAAGAPLGTENYFTIRGAAADLLRDLGEEVR